MPDDESPLLGGIFFTENLDGLTSVTSDSMSLNRDGSWTMIHSDAEGGTKEERWAEFVGPEEVALEPLVLKKEWEGHSIDLVDPTGQWEVSLPTQGVSGCYHVRAYTNGAGAGLDNGDEDNEDYIHICDLDAFIAMLQHARALRNAFVGGETIPECVHPFRTTKTVNGVTVVDACPACGYGIGGVTD